jgi:hypothetical protein
MSRIEARQTRRDASYAVREEVRERVRQALMHLEDPSYRDRLLALVEESKLAVPGLTGRTADWIGRIVAVRNGFAHQLRDSETELEEHLVLLRSLRWLLTSLLLIEAGTVPEVLAGRLGQHQPYLHLRRQAQRWLPSVYAKDDWPTP